MRLSTSHGRLPFVTATMLAFAGCGGETTHTFREDFSGGLLAARWSSLGTGTPAIDDARGAPAPSAALTLVSLNQVDPMVVTGRLTVRAMLQGDGRISIVNVDADSNVGSASSTIDGAMTFRIGFTTADTQAPAGEFQEVELTLDEDGTLRWRRNGAVQLQGRYDRRGAFEIGLHGEFDGAHFDEIEASY